MNDTNWPGQKPLLLLTTATADFVYPEEDNYTPGYQPPKLIGLYDSQIPFWQDRVLLVFAAIASVLMGAGVMIWAFIGAVVISAMVGVAAVARGVSLIMSGFSERNQLDKEQAAAA